MASRTLKMREATITEDRWHATNGVIVLGGKNWARRVRSVERENLKNKMIDVYADVTLRWRLASGAETEGDKILRGAPDAADYYLYAWVRLDLVLRWIGYDVRRAVAAGVIHRGLPEKQNTDKLSWMAFVETEALARTDCIIGQGNYESIFETDADDLTFRPDLDRAPSEAAPPREAVTRHMKPAPRPAWPNALGGLGHRRVEAFVSCAECQTGTWVRYGAIALCLDCALERAEGCRGEACGTCGGETWWLSIHGRRVCRRCHPPAPGAEAPDA
jgi:hypothetical protein